MLMRFPILLSWLLNLILLVGPMDSPAALAQQPPVNLYVSPNGQDTNLGTQDQPVQTITRALRMAQAGDTVYIRGGTYDTIFGGYIFRNSGMEQAPITVTNFPGEQVVLRITNRDERYPAFRCWSTSDWRTPKADYIRVVGTPVESVTL